MNRVSVSSVVYAIALSNVVMYVYIHVDVALYGMNVRVYIRDSMYIDIVGIISMNVGIYSP
jgi:hypothetical protein